MSGLAVPTRRVTPWANTHFSVEAFHGVEHILHVWGLQVEKDKHHICKRYPLHKDLPWVEFLEATEGLRWRHATVAALNWTLNGSFACGRSQSAHVLYAALRHWTMNPYDLPNGLFLAVCEGGVRSGTPDFVFAQPMAVFDYYATTRIIRAIVLRQNGCFPFYPI
jgi:hypothetical protein